MKIHVKNPRDAAAIIPYLLGYQPQNSLTFMAIENGEIACTGAQELPDGPDYRPVAEHLARVLTVNNLSTIVLVGYGPYPSMQDAVEQAIDVLDGFGITVVDAMRVGENQVWHVGCDEPGCHHQGLPYDPDSTVVAAAATYLGMQVAPGRDVLAARLDPVTGADHDAMIAALEKVRDDVTVPQDSEQIDELVAEAIAGRMPDERAARLLILLGFPRVRDYAAHLVHGTVEDIRAWTDLTRRSGTGPLSCAPAMLLAMAALQYGDGVTATLAARRACVADPHDELAALLAHAIELGLSPQALIDALHD